MIPDSDLNPINNPLFLSQYFWKWMLKSTCHRARDDVPVATSDTARVAIGAVMLLTPYGQLCFGLSANIAR